MCVCLPDVQDQISGYLIVIACMFCSPDAYLLSLSVFQSIGLEVLLLVIVDFYPVLEPHLSLPPCLPFIQLGILTFCG